MISLRPIKAIKGEYTLPADREQFLAALIMAGYSEEPQKLNLSPEALEDQMVQWAHRTGIGITLQNDGIEIRGGGWALKPTTLEIHTLGSLYADLMQISWARFHRKSFELKGFSESYLQFVRPFVKSIGGDFEYSISEEDPQIKIPIFRSSDELPAIPKEFPAIAPWLRNDRLLQYWPAFKETEFKELFSGRDFLINLAQTWGNHVEKQVPNLQELSEIERRLLKMRGGIQDRRSTFKIVPSLTHRKRFYPLWGNSTFAACLATLGVCTPGSDFILKDVLLSAGRTHFFQIARKLGADIEILQRKESLGESYGNVRVRYTRELIGRKISGESLYQSIEEFALLALLASRAEGETVIRGFAKLPGQFKTALDKLMSGLKQTTVDIGEFEDGLVVRGKPELDGSEFDAADIPHLSQAYWVLGCIAKGNSTVKHANENSICFLNQWLENHNGQ